MKRIQNLILFILIGIIIVLVNICILDRSKINSLREAIASDNQNVLQEEKHILDVGIQSGIITGGKYSDNPAPLHIIEQDAWKNALNENPSLRKLGDFLP